MECRQRSKRIRRSGTHKVERVHVAVYHPHHLLERHVRMRLLRIHVENVGEPRVVIFASLRVNLAIGAMLGAMHVLDLQPEHRVGKPASHRHVSGE